MEHSEPDKATAVRAARLYLYRWLAAAATDPAVAGWRLLQDAQLQAEASAAAEYLRQLPEARPEAVAPGEIESTLLDTTQMISFLDTETDWAAEYMAVFGLLGSQECPPYETDYCPQTLSVYRAQQLADIAGFYAAFGLEPSTRRPEKQDHITLELEFMAWLIAKEQYALSNDITDGVAKAEACRDAQETFFQNHLAWWVPAFAFALRKKTDGLEDPAERTAPPASFYGSLGHMLAAFISVERALLGVEPPVELAAVRVEDPASVSCEGCGFADASAAPGAQQMPSKEVQEAQAKRHGE
jgi:TorA maturation chaperone TorD